LIILAAGGAHTLSLTSECPGASLGECCQKLESSCFPNEKTPSGLLTLALLGRSTSRLLDYLHSTGKPLQMSSTACQNNVAKVACGLTDEEIRIVEEATR